MKSDKLIDAIGEVDDDLIEEAGEKKPAARVTYIGWRRWGGLAAALVLVIGLGVFSQGGGWNFGSSSSSSAEATDEASSEAAAAEDSEEPMLSAQSEDGMVAAAAPEEDGLEGAVPESEDVSGNSDAYILEAPPILSIEGIEALQLDYDWNYQADGDNWNSVLADADLWQELGDIPQVFTEDGTFRIFFEEALPSYTTVTWWSVEDYQAEKLDTDLPCETGSDGIQSAQLPDGVNDCIVMISGDWGSDCFNGTCRYLVRVTLEDPGAGVECR